MTKGNGKANGKKPTQEIGVLPAVQTDKQRRFVEEYCVDFNATQSAIRAGYSENSAAEIGWQNLRKLQIRTAIEERLAELTMSSAEAAMRLTAWGRGSLEPFLTETGHVDIANESAQENLHLLKKVKVSRRSGGEDEDDIITTEIELHDAKDAVIQMAKLHGMFNDRHKDESGGVMTTSDIEELYEAFERVADIREFERLLVGAAKEQLG